MIDFLTENEKAAVQMFNESDVMRNAVKKVLLYHLYNCGVMKPAEAVNPMVNRALVLVQQYKGLGNDKVGEALRVFEEATSMVESAFNDMANLKKVEAKKPTPNRAR